MSLKDKTPLISLIIPVYNARKYITQCLYSVMNQTYKNLEIIVVDDGSNDGSLDLCEEIAANDSRICLIHQENAGPSAARNIGLDNANGEYISFIDSDDYISEKMIANLYSLLVCENADMSVCNFERYDEKTKEYSSSEIKTSDEIINSNVALERLFKPNALLLVLVWNKLYKRKLWDNVRFPLGLLHEDEVVAHHILGKCKRIAITPDVLYIYRKTSGSIMERPYNITRCDRYYAFSDRALFVNRTNRKDLLWKAVDLYWKDYYENYFLFIDDPDQKRLKQMKNTIWRMFPLLMKTHHFAGYKDVLGTFIFMFNPKIYQKIFLGRNISNKG